MTIARALIVGFALFMQPYPAEAQSVFVTAGEHSDFTRVFLDAPPDTSWTLDFSQNAIEFSINGTGDGFNLSRAYERISDQRVSGFSPVSSNTLRIDLSCDCEADATDWGQGDVVIDIRDRNEDLAATTQPERNDRPTNVAYDWKQNVLLQSRHRTAPRAPFAPNIPSEHTAPLLGSSPTTNQLLEIRRNASSNRKPIDSLGTFPMTPAGFPNATLAIPELAQDNTSSAIALDFQNALIRQLQRAASQGVINLAGPEIRSQRQPEVDAKPPVTVPDARAEDTHGTRPVEPASLRQLVVTTAQDEALPGRDSLRLLAPQSLGCLPNEWFDPKSWAMSSNAPGFAGLRAGLVGEFDRANMDNVLKLAHYYLYLGFGLEARELIKTFPVSSPNSRTIEQIARLLDGADVTDPSALTSQVGCSPAATLWALVAEPDQAFNPDLEVSAVLAAFSAFPVHLRNLIGPELAKRFSDAGKRNAVIAIRNLVDRSYDADTESLNMIDAEIDIADGDVDGASRELSAVISEDRSLAAEAMIKLITERKRAGLSVGTEVASAADALAVEYRGTELGQQLTEAAIRAFSISGQPQITFDRIHEAQARNAIEPETIRNLINQAFLDSAQNSEDVAFLRLVHREELPDTNQQDARQMRQDKNTRIAVAVRLIDLGFYDKASEILAPFPPKKSADIRFQFARIAFGTGRFDDAITLLTGRYDRPAQEIRANALFRMGDYATATTIFDQIERRDDAVHAAWISGDFERAAQLDTRPLVQLVALSEISAPRIDSLEDVDQPLKAWRQATQHSRTLRDTIRQILE